MERQQAVIFTESGDKVMIKKLDKFCDVIWLIGLTVIGAVIAILLVLNWSTWLPGTKAGAFLAIIMPLHVWEEWKLPGGLHYIYNIIFGPKEYGNKYLDRYPMSRFTDTITNIGLAIIPLIYAVLAQTCGLSNIVSVCIIILSFGQVLAHTIVGCYAWKRYYKTGKRFCYCPGHITALTMFLPAGIYLCSVITNVTLTDILGGILAMVILGVVCVPLQEIPLKKWVLKQENNAFAFEDPKYFAKFIDKDIY